MRVGSREGPFCDCWRKRPVPIDVVVETLPALQRTFAKSTMGPDAPILTWRCRECKATVVLTARDLHLAA